MVNNIKRENEIAKRSLKLSKREINNVRLESRDFYFSNSKANVFLESLGKNVGNNEKSVISGMLHNKIVQVTGTKEINREINLSQEVKKAIKKAKRKKIIVPYEKCQRGKYILVHMPFYNGSLELKSLKEYPNVYWWYGTYRNLTIYSCGNCANVVDGIDGVGNIDVLWNPSGSHASKKLFDRIDNYVSKENVDINELLDGQLFSNLQGLIHNGTMRGKKTKYSHGWYDMLIRCDEVEKRNGEIKIFASPVFATHDTYQGYGWYYIGHDTNWTYYQEKRNGKNCDYVMKVGPAEEKTVILNSYTYNKIPYGSDYGYRKERIDGKNKLHFLKKVECVSSKNIEFVDKETENRNEDFMVKAVCITTLIIKQKIHYYIGHK